MAVYFIVDVLSGTVKIGKASDPSNRFQSLQTGSSVRLFLIGVIDGDRVEERELHERFADARVRGEWFYLKPIWNELVGMLDQTKDLIECRDTRELIELLARSGPEKFCRRPNDDVRRIGLSLNQNCGRDSLRRACDALEEFAERSFPINPEIAYSLDKHWDGIGGWYS